MFEELFDFEGKVAVVTGGSSGIGLSFSETLLRLGVKVAIVNRSSETGLKAQARLGAQGGNVKAFPADVSKKEEVEAMVSAVEDQLGPIDILINSAGINIRKKAIDFEPAEWKQILDINLTGTFLTCQAVGRKMIERRNGRILNVSSVAAVIGLSDRAAYCASKGGVSQLTRALAVEWGPFGVTVNAIGPGFTRTPLIANLINDSRFRDKIKNSIPLQRIGETQDLQGVLLLLCSKAGAYINGQTIYVDGGWSAM